MAAISLIHSKWVFGPVTSESTNSVFGTNLARPLVATSCEEWGQALTLDIDLMIFSTLFLNSLSSDIRKENL